MKGANGKLKDSTRGSLADTRQQWAKQCRLTKETTCIGLIWIERNAAWYLETRSWSPTFFPQHSRPSDILELWWTSGILMIRIPSIQVRWWNLRILRTRIDVRKCYLRPRCRLGKRVLFIPRAFNKHPVLNCICTISPLHVFLCLSSSGYPRG